MIQFSSSMTWIVKMKLGWLRTTAARCAALRSDAVVAGVGAFGGSCTNVHATLPLHQS